MLKKSAWFKLVFLAVAAMMLVAAGCGQTGDVASSPAEVIVLEEAPEVEAIEAEEGEYVGEVDAATPNGHGTLTTPEGDVHMGQFVDGKLHGHGVYTAASGSQYVGMFENGKFNGHGVFVSTGGDKYIGMFKDDKFEGYGTLFRTDGTIERGIWEGSVLVEAQ